MKPDRLREIPLFEGLSVGELERLATWTDEIDFPAGKPLVRQGSYPHEFMVIERGTVEVTHDGEHLADLGPGDFFGEMALLSHHPRMASIESTTDVSLVVMHERNFRAMQETMAAVATRIADTMAERERIAAEKGIET
jgi:CRP-like cAMP-binding protein